MQRPRSTHGGSPLRDLTRLAFRDIFGNQFRSCIIVTCALLVAGFALATTLIVRGSEDSLRAAQQRLGADIVVVPEGAESDAQGALLMGAPMRLRMPTANVQKVAAVPGVAAASPQLSLATVVGSAYCSAPNMFVVAYDPASDFTLGPWLEERLGEPLRPGRSVGGTFVFVPPGDRQITIYGFHLTLAGNLEPTGTTIDQSLFITFETARAMGRLPAVQAEQGFVNPDDFVSAVMVKVAPGFDPKLVAAEIRRSVPGASPINSPELFGSFRTQMEGQRAGMLTILGVVLALSLAIIVLIFSMAVNERRREIGVLRALGATRGAVLRSLLTGAAALALCGGLAGIVLSGLILYFFRHKLVSLFGFPFLFPSLPTLLLLVVIGLAVALAGVMLAAFIPAYRISRQEPAVSMRE